MLGSSFLFGAHGFRSLSPQLFDSVVWACGGSIPCGESTQQKWILHLMVYEKPREQDEEMVFQISPFTNSSLSNLNPFQMLISERLCSLKQAPCADDQVLHIYLPNHHREKVFVWSLIYSLKCSHPDCLDCKYFQEWVSWISLGTSWPLMWHYPLFHISSAFSSWSLRQDQGNWIRMDS